jgi:chorismate mutase
VKTRKPPLCGRRFRLQADLKVRRGHLQSLDEGIICAISRAVTGREALHDEIVKLKKELDLPTADPAWEKKKLQLLKRKAKELGIPWEFIEPILQWLFSQSKAKQTKILMKGGKISKKGR